jgi:hypothetical protein
MGPLNFMQFLSVHTLRNNVASPRPNIIEINICPKSVYNRRLKFMGIYYTCGKYIRFERTDSPASTYVIYCCTGTLEISLGFVGHVTSSCENEKHVPVLSLYCNMLTFSGVGYTYMVRRSGIDIYTANNPMTKLSKKMRASINLNIPMFVIV